MADHLETEQKYEASAAFALPPLAVLPGVSRVSEPERQLLDATYFDTPDLALIQNKVTLRRRTGGPDEGWHLKLPVRSGTRQELHEPLGATEVPPRLAAAVEQLTAGRPLNPIASLFTERTVLRLCDSAGAVLAEVADDQVTARRLNPDGGPAAPALSWREIEIELAGHAGTGGLLDAASDLLRQAGARPARSASKLARLLDEIK